MKIKRKELNRLIESFLLKEEIADKVKPTFSEVRSKLRNANYGLDDISSTMRVAINEGPHAGKSGLMIIIFDGARDYTAKKILNKNAQNDEEHKDKDPVEIARMYPVQDVQDQTYKFLKGIYGEEKVKQVDIKNLDYEKGKSGRKDIAFRRIKTLDSGKENPVISDQHGGARSRLGYFSNYGIEYLKKDAGQNIPEYDGLSHELKRYNNDLYPDEYKKYGDPQNYSDTHAQFFTVVIPSVDK